MWCGKPFGGIEAMHLTGGYGIRSYKEAAPLSADNSFERLLIEYQCAVYEEHVLALKVYNTAEHIGHYVAYIHYVYALVCLAKQRRKA